MTSSFIKGLHNVKPGYPEIFLYFVILEFSGKNGWIKLQQHWFSE